MAIDFTSAELGEEGKDSYSVLRGPFDQWLAEKAEEAGAEYICGIAVEELIKDGSGRVTGVRAGDDEITADVVILAEGTNSMLSERCLGNARPKADQMAVGIKGGLRASRQRHRGPLPAPRGRGRGHALRGRLHQGQRRRRLPVHQQGVHLARPGGHHLPWPPTAAATRCRSTRCSRTSRTTRPWRRSSAAPRWSSTPATWCPRAATT